MEPLEKRLTNDITAKLDEDGTLTLTEVIQPPEDEPPVLAYGEPEDEEPTVTTIAMSAQAARALLRLLHSPAGRKLIGARVLQQ